MAPDDRRNGQMRVRNQREYEEITALLRVLRAANFDLGDPNNSDDERLLTRILQERREKFERMESWQGRRSNIGKWIIMAIGGATVTLFGQDLHTWLKSHLP